MHLLLIITYLMLAARYLRLLIVAVGLCSGIAHASLTAKIVGESRVYDSGSTERSFAMSAAFGTKLSVVFWDGDKPVTDLKPDINKPKTLTNGIIASSKDESDPSKLIISVGTSATTTVTVMYDDKPLTVTVAGFQPVEAAGQTVQIDGKKLDLSKSAVINVPAKESYELSVVGSASGQNPRFHFAFTNGKVNDETHLWRIASGTKLAVSSVGDGDIKVLLTGSFDQAQPKEFTLHRIPVAKSVTVDGGGDLRLKVGETKSFKLVPSAEDALEGATVTINASSGSATQTAVATLRDNTLEISANAPTDGGTITLSGPGLESDIKLKLIIERVATTLSFSRNAVLVGEKVQTNSEFSDSAGVKFTPSEAPVFTVSPAGILSVTTKGNGVLEFSGLAEGDAVITATLGNASVSTTVKVNVVAGFRPIKADLKVMDSETVRMLFGPKILSQFYVVRAHLVNNLSGSDAGKSIIVYSDTFEAGIELEQKYDGTRRAANPRNFSDKEWREVTQRDLESTYARAKDNELNKVPESEREQTLAREANFSVSGQSANALIMGPGESRRLVFRDAKGGKVEASWEVVTKPSPGFISISSGGLITAATAGFTEGTLIVNGTATIDKQSRTKEILIYLKQSRVSAGQLTATATTYKLALGDYLTLPIVPDTDTVTVSDPGLIEIFKDGTVAPRAAGTALITVKRKYGSDKITEYHVVVVVESPSAALPSGVFLDDGELKYTRATLRYRPYSNDIVMGVQDFFIDHGSRATSFRIAYGLADLLAGLSVVYPSRFGDKGQTAVNAANGILLPVLERVFPDRSSVYRANLAGMTMRPLEEIPFGGEVTKILMFPKQNIGGMIPGMLVRISAIDCRDFDVQVGVVEKRRNTGQ